MDELPPWLIAHSQNPVLRDVLQEVFANKGFRGHLDGIFAPPEGQGYQAYVGDLGLLEQLNKASSKRKYEINPNTAAVAMIGTQPYGGISIDVDKIHELVQQDSAQARGLVRDALVHELGHLIPAAQGKGSVGDPRPGSNVKKHPVIQNENLLRGLLGLPEKDFYGLQPGAK